jgi:hypothetical protein
MNMLRSRPAQKRENEGHDQNKPSSGEPRPAHDSYSFFLA